MLLRMYTQIDITHVTHYDGEQLSRELGFANYFKTSAKHGIGINEAIQFMVEKVSIHYI